MKMKKLKANIPSKKEFFVNENGEILNSAGRVLRGKINPNSKTLKTLDFLNSDHKRQAMSFQKIVWNTFHPEDLVQENEIIQLINPSHEFPFAISNLRKTTRKESVKRINEIRLNMVKERKSKND